MIAAPSLLVLLAFLVIVLLVTELIWRIRRKIRRAKRELAALDNEQWNGTKHE